MGRFISADAFASTGQGFVGNNMFAYCLNNPVNMADNCGYAPEGLIAISLLSFLDGPLPFVDVLVGTTLLVFATYQLASETTSLLLVIIFDRADTSFIPEPKKNKEPTRIPAPGPQKNTKRDNDVLVYRWAKRRSSSAREYQNLTPRPWTDDGLSFSLVPTTSKENATTTLGALRGGVCLRCQW